MDRIVGVFIGLGLLSVFFWIIESVFAARPAQPPVYRRRGFRTDLVYWFATPIVTRTVSQIGLALILVLIYREDVAGIQRMLATRDTWITRQPMGVQLIGMLVCGDLVGYWVHRGFHGRKLWRFHAVHHSSEDLDWLSSVRVHPVNVWVNRWIQATVLVLVGFAPVAVAAYVPFLTFYAVFLHANVSWGFGPLGRLVASPRFHRWHHTAQVEGRDKNFAGLFPFWDLLFGTYYMPRGRQPERFGVQEAIPTGYVGQLLYPLRSRASAKPVPGPGLDSPGS